MSFVDLQLVHQAIHIVAPGFGIQVNQLVGDHFETRFPTISALQRMMHSALGVFDTAIQWVGGEIPRDDFFRLHQEGRVPVGLSLKSIFLGDFGYRVHPALYSRHDFYHAACFLRATPMVRNLAAGLYLAGRAVETLVSDSPIGQQFMGGLIDMEIDYATPDFGFLTKFNAMSHALESEDLRFFKLLYVQLGLRAWEGEQEVIVAYIMDQLAIGLFDRALPPALL